MMDALGRRAAYVSSVWSTVSLVVAALLIMIPCCRNAFAQSGAGAIQGTVTDAGGAVIPNASIHVLNTATGVASDTKTNNVGFYQSPGLFAGTYMVRIVAPGMETIQRTIQLLVGQRAVVNASLKVGSTTETVEVTGDAVQLVTPTSGVISSTLENSRISQLPMNGRNVLTLVQETTPGLGTCSESTSSCPSGLAGNAMEYSVDGVTMLNGEFGGTHVGASEIPDPDSIQEVRVEMNGSGAESATPATGILTTKSGTNHLHGSLFETARNNYFGVARSRANPSNYVAPHLVRNEFGASAGGPIVLPHLYDGKDKSFWFFAYERYSLASSSYQLMSVPTVAMRNGDFSGLTNSSNVLQQLYDPNTTTYNAAGGAYGSWPRQEFANNQIPQTRESPTAKIFSDITPLPTTNDNPGVAPNLNALAPNYQVTPNITFRLDHVFNQNNRAYLRYTQTGTNYTFLRNDPAEPASVAADGMPANASGVSLNQYNLFAPAIGFTHIFSPTFFSETILSQQWFGEQNYAGGTPFANFEQQLGLPNNFGEIGLPIIGSGEIFSPFDGTQFQYGMTQTIVNLDENLTKIYGRHQFLFGIRVRHEHFGSRPNEIEDTVTFNGMATGIEDPTSKQNYTAVPNTGNANADEFLGAASGYTVNTDPPYGKISNNEFDGYFQDNFHVSRGLLLNLGLRYEAHPSPVVGDGLMLAFDIPNRAVVTALTPQELVAKGYTTQNVITNDENIGMVFETPEAAHMPSTMMRNYDFTFGPRVGFAWTPDPNYGTVVRGAYGRFIYPEPIGNFLKSFDRRNPFTLSYGESYTAANQSPDGLKDYLLRSKQSVVMGVNSANVVNSSSITAILPGVGLQTNNPDFPPNYVTQANLTVEQPMKGNSALRLSYIYTHGTNLDQIMEYNNQPSAYNWEMRTGTIPPTGSVIGSNQYAATAMGPYDQVTYGSNTLTQKSGWSNYNALQANYQRLFHHGVAYQISYVWAKSMSTQGAGAAQNDILPYADYIDSGLGVMTQSYGPEYAPALPPPPPSNTPSYGYYRALNRFENYSVDTTTPKQQVLFNGIFDLPIGRGKRYFGHVNRFVDELIGGYEIAGAGNVTSQDFAVTSTNWGPTNPLKVYKHGAPITDCRSGVCYKSYEWFNGYIAPTAISGNTCSAGLSTVVSGLPSNWSPYQSPADQICSAPSGGKVVTDKYFGKDEVNVTTTNGVTAPLAYAPSPGGSNPYSKTVLNGPFNYSADISLFKVFPITESVNLRVNVDAFNAFNIQGYNNPSGTDGTESLRSSFNTPRQIQLTARLTF
ncbi:hypothetical protein GCM10011507_14440 [Edaphobacter acidisoli]|uniref:TonB-dependent transporter Oar-like beta-barrel domain-containing protein n=1 Tax=Edaphobacter acidisoli TaxID=2040573 RepID=A0A916RNL1_9BACT|nr:carboxypeptidase-like regulatory domain-containing protein [Edaphobacter acidisoli]GGA63938.1 hypothetical protein GCM10011507_14440 [Edaphobacter acidisoli]